MIINEEEINIKKWLDEVMATQSWSDHDLHIDRINSELKTNKTDWINKSLEFLKFAQNCLNGSDFRVVLTIPLRSTYASRGTDVIDLSKLSAAELSNTPPALYLYKKEDSRYIKIKSKLVDYPYQLLDGKWLCNFHESEDDQDSQYVASIHMQEKA